MIKIYYYVFRLIMDSGIIVLYLTGFIFIFRLVLILFQEGSKPWYDIEDNLNMVIVVLFVYGGMTYAFGFVISDCLKAFI